MPPGFVLRLYACSHRHLLQTQSFLYLVSRGSGRRESWLATRPKEWAEKLLSSAAQALVPSQGQVPACPRSPHSQPPLLGEGQASPGQAGSLSPLHPPGMWGPPGSLCGSWHCPPEEAWGRMGVLELGPVPTTAFLPCRSESPGPTPCTSCWPCGERPRIPFPGSARTPTPRGREEQG